MDCHATARGSNASGNCIYRTSRPSQGTVNGGAVSKWPRCRWDVKHNQPGIFWIFSLNGSIYAKASFQTSSPGPTSPNIFFPIVHDRDKFSNREQSETNRNDEIATYDYLSEYIRMCFQLHKDSSRPFLNILRTFCKRSKTKWEQFPRNTQIVQNIIWMILIFIR